MTLRYLLDKIGAPGLQRTTCNRVSSGVRVDGAKVPPETGPQLLCRARSCVVSAFTVPVAHPIPTRSLLGRLMKLGALFADVFVDDSVIQVWSKNHLVKTVARVRKGPVRKVRADGLHVKHQPNTNRQASAGT